MEGITFKPDGKGRLRVTFPFSKARIEQIKRIPGCRRLSDGKARSVPDTLEVHKALDDMLTTSFPFPATAIMVAPHKPGEPASHKNPTTSTPGKPITSKWISRLDPRHHSGEKHTQIGVHPASLCREI